MLVLARRKREKVLFPKLGISIDILEIRGNAVRLGVNAPREVRVIRDELSHQRNRLKAAHGTPGLGHDCVPPSQSGDTVNVEELRKQLDAANLAIHLAQNQLMQGKDDYAEEALQHAIGCLQEIEKNANLCQEQSLLVREAKSNYRYAMPMTAAIIDGCKAQRELVAETLRQQNVMTDTYDDALQGISELCDHPALDLVLMIQPENLPANNHSIPHLNWGGFAKLNREEGQFLIAGHPVIAWTAEDFSLARLVS